MLNKYSIAYFSMEIGLENEILTYSGGLGILAGDTLKSAADLGLPIIGLSLIYYKGYFKQHITNTGEQKELYLKWNPSKFLKKVNHTIVINIEKRKVKVTAWRYDIKGINGHIVPVFFLDTHLPENSKYDQSLTDNLYGGDDKYRICQEILLGIGGVKLLKTLKVGNKKGNLTYHMNEGHAAFLILELLKELQQYKKLTLSEAKKVVKSMCVFTTHTPVPAGHDRFSKDLIYKTLDKTYYNILEKSKLISNNTLNMTHLALEYSKYINAVAKKHQQVSQKMFKGFVVEAITNGIHARTWVAKPFAKLYDKYIPLWKHDNNYFRYACEIPLLEIQKAHQQCKQNLIKEIYKKYKIKYNPKIFTIGFARRATGYKRADFLFTQPQKLIKIAKQYGGLQIVFAGKAHPKDFEGKSKIKSILDYKNKLKKYNIKIVYFENYDMKLGKLITSGVDLWLNNPQKPLEASGTSGMKSAVNAIPSLSTLDGWWVEGCFEDITGWEIEDHSDALKPISATNQKLLQNKASENMYYKLKNKILHLYYKKPLEYLKIMRNCIVINGCFFNTQRMVQQYAKNAYKLIP